MGHRTKGVNVASHERSSEAIEWGALHADLRRVHAGDPDLHPFRTSGVAPQPGGITNVGSAPNVLPNGRLLLHRRRDNNDVTARYQSSLSPTPSSTRSWRSADLRPRALRLQPALPCAVAGHVHVHRTWHIAAAADDDHHGQRDGAGCARHSATNASRRSLTNVAGPVSRPHSHHYRRERGPRRHEDSHAATPIAGADVHLHHHGEEQWPEHRDWREPHRHRSRECHVRNDRDGPVRATRRCTRARRPQGRSPVVLGRSQSTRP